MAKTVLLYAFLYVAFGLLVIGADVVGERLFGEASKHILLVLVLAGVGALYGFSEWGKRQKASDSRPPTACSDTGQGE